MFPIDAHNQNHFGNRVSDHYSSVMADTTQTTPFFHMKIPIIFYPSHLFAAPRETGEGAARRRRQP